jgi:putative peptidoglycan lipid II flippase
MLLMVPGTVGLAAVQINQFVNTVLATDQGTGAVSWLNYAFRIIYLPIGLFGVSIATAAIPAIAAMAAHDDRDGLRATVSRGLRLMFVLNVPATLGLIVLASPVVALIFERGSFTARDTPATAAALMFYAPGLLGYSIVKIVSPTFYALKDSRTPVMVSALSVAVNVLLNVLLVRALGYRGLALGTAVSAMVNGLTLLVLLRRRIGGIDERHLIASFTRVLGASAVMALAVAVCAYQLGLLFPARAFWSHALQVSVSIAVGLAVFVGAGRAFRIEELDEALGRITSRFLGRAPQR